MKEFYKERLELLKSGESFVLASIFDSQGSAIYKGDYIELVENILRKNLNF